MNGYPNSSVVPSYRQAGLGQIVYSGINGSFQITNQPLPYGAIGDKYIQILKENKISENISTLEKFASQNIDIQLGRDLTELAGVVYNNTGIQCANIYMKYSPETFLKILSNINTKLITIFLELDKQLGCLDELDIDTTDKRLVELEFWKPVFVNLVSNILWKILGIVVTLGILAWISNSLTTTH